MLRLLPYYIISSMIVLSFLYLARASDNFQFTDSLFFAPSEYSSQSGVTVKGGTDSLSANDSPLQYREGDWYKYVIEPSYKKKTDELEKLNLYKEGDININTFGSASFDFKYGKSMFTSSKYKQYDEDTPFSRVISSGFTPEQVIILHMEGEVGERITVYIDHDSRRKDNRYLMQYRAVDDDEVVREINTGEIDINFNHSRYAVYDNRGVKGLGADFTLAKSGLRIKGFASVSRGETEVEYFRGNSSPGSIKISEYQYLKRAYYQLEPFIRYDNAAIAPPDDAAVNSSIAVTSEPADPESYSSYQVNIIPSGFELYMDDQNPYNNQGAIILPFDGGYYTRLVNGTDYSINYTTGVIKFLRNIPEKGRIFAAYNVEGGTRDTFALKPGDADHPGGAFAGKTIVFIKYGNSLSDIGKRDVYEIRSYFYIGARNILPAGFSLNFYRENNKMTDAEVKLLSRYSIDRGNGIISFSTREPFRRLFTDTAAADRIYSEVQPSDVYTLSRYRIGADYNVEARSFQLKHFNLIENSVKVKVNGKEISSSLYSVDYYSGFLVFSDPNNPLITADTNIEIKYEYLPFGSSDSSFMGGVRADYDLTRDIRIGGTVLISRGADSEVVPDVGSESDQTVVLEGDASLNLGQKRLADLYNAVTGSRVSSIPLEVKAYGEVAKSIKNTNIFGKALIDNMESTDEIVSVSLSEKDWQLSSMPDGRNEYQEERGELYYWYYRDPWSPETLKGPGFTPYAVPYSVKPGPYNIAMGHIDNSIVEQSSQRSLVFDFNFASGNYVTVAARNLADEAVDMSGLQYVEVWVKYEGSESDGVDLFIDLGVIDEDSDDDGVLDTEDRNRNGFIDSNPSAGYSEDRGYSFNGNNQTVVGSGPGLSSYTLGDGVLNTEDLNGNGVLDRDENVYKIELGPVGRNGGNWQRIRVPVNLTDSDVNTLKQVITARLYLKEKSDVAGRLYISSLKFVASKWKNPEKEGGDAASPEEIKVTRINSISDDDYRAESFMLLQRGVYESLYGSKSSDDLKSESESALQIDYDIPAGSSNVSITRTFSTTFDIRNYKTLNLWVNERAMTTGDVIGIIIGSSDDDYIEYRGVAAMPRTWTNLRLKLKSGSAGDIDIDSSSGNIDFRRIKYIKFIVYGAPGSTGEIWLNDIYLSEPETLTGKAQWYEGEVAFKRPVYVTEAGVPVLSDMRVKYLYRGNSANFTSPGKGDDEIEESAYELSSSFKILPHWGTGIDYTREQSSSDSRDENLPYDRRGNTEREQVLFTTAYRSPGQGGASINLSYAIDRFNNLKERNYSSDIYTEESSRIVHTPVISYDQRFAGFLDGTLTARMLLNMAFSALSLNRYSDTISDETLQEQYGGDERDRRQRSELLVHLNYTGKYFFLRPKFSVMSEEVVDIRGDRRSEEAGIKDELAGGYHLPFTGRDMKYLERRNGSEVVLGFPGAGIVMPELTFSADYREESFSDYDTEVLSSKGKFIRSRDAGSYFLTRVRVPISLKDIPMFKNVRQLQLNYLRGISVNEEGVPYEGENKGFFSEEYGFSRVMSEVSGNAFNLFGNYPGKFFTGRGNFSGGRDLVYYTMNRGVEDSSESVDYNNSLKLVDDISLDFAMDTGLFDLSVKGGLNQICERSNIYGIPNQVVTFNSGFTMRFDLMNLFSSGFFRDNKAGLPFHSSSLDLGFAFSDRMFITSNIDEKTYSPETGVIFRRDRSSLSLSAAVDLRVKKDREFIDYSTSPDGKDYIYISNMPEKSSFSEKDYGYRFSSVFETDVVWIYDYFSMLYKLTALPVFSFEYNMAFNRYDYFNKVSPEPYDLFMIKSSLTLDLHKNVRGGVGGALSLERFRNRDDQGISREVLSYEVSGNITILF